jgi:endonuclease/exonuclease/phosphatase family metal-dependent hydrolase
MTQSRIRSILLAALILLFGLHVLRIFLPTVIWYLGQYLGAQQLALYALATFALALLAPLVRRGLGERGALALTAGGLSVVRLAIQFVSTPLAHLVLGTAGLVLWGWFVPLWHQSSRNRPTGHDVPVLAVAFPLAFILDTGSRTLLLSYDLAWRHSWWAVLTAVGLVALALVLLWRELADRSLKEAAGEPSLGRVWPFLGLGPWLYLALAVTHNPAALAASTGWDDTGSHLAVNGFTALGAVLCVLVTGWPTRRRWLGALVDGGLLAGALTLLVGGVGPGWLWHAIASLTSWMALGRILAGTTRMEPLRPGSGQALRPGLWRTALTTFLALLVMLAIVFLVSQFDLRWMTVVAGVILWAAATWAARIEARQDRAALWAMGARVGAVAVVALLIVGLWALLSRTPQAVEGPPADRPLRVMTYNIHQGIDADLGMNLEAIADAIAAENPDAVALNEVNRARATNGFVDVLLLISRRAGLPYVFGLNYADGQYGNAVLSRYPVLEWDNTHYTHNTTEVRGLLRVVVAAPGGPITFYATHLDHVGSPNNARAAQVAEALAVWNGAPRSVLLGDLNAEPDKPELQAIYRAGFVDALAATGHGDVFTFWDPLPTPGRRIDFIFVTPDLALGRVWVVQTRASDHLPVLAEVGP